MSTPAENLLEEYLALHRSKPLEARVCIHHSTFGFGRKEHCISVADVDAAIQKLNARGIAPSPVYEDLLADLQAQREQLAARESKEAQDEETRVRADAHALAELEDEGYPSSRAKVSAALLGVGLTGPADSVARGYAHTLRWHHKTEYLFDEDIRRVFNNRVRSFLEIDEVLSGRELRAELSRRELSEPTAQDVKAAFLSVFRLHLRPDSAEVARACDEHASELRRQRDVAEKRRQLKAAREQKLRDAMGAGPDEAEAEATA